MTGFSQHERNGLAKMQVAEQHPDADLLTAFAEQTLTPREREQMLAHLAVCGECREVIGYSAPERAVETVPQVVLKPALWRWPVLRWGAVAASAVIVVGAVSLGIHERTTRNELAKTQLSQPQSANTQPSNGEVKTPVTEAPAAKAVPAELEPNLKGPTQTVELGKRDKDVISEYKSTGTSGLKSAQVRYEKLPEDQKSQVAKLEADKLVVAQAAPAVSEIDRPAMGNAVRDVKPALSAGASIHGSATEFNANSTIGQGASRQYPVPAPAAKMAPLRAQEDVAVTDQAARKADTSMNYSAPAPPPPLSPASQAVEVQSEIVQTESSRAQASSIPAMKKQVKERADLKPLERPKMVGGLGAGNASLMNLRWQLSPDGILTRSGDQGKSWEPVLSDHKFSTVAVVATEVWAGGASGLLMHSIDGGQSWMPVKPFAKKATITGDVVSLRFSDAKQGTVTTSSGETWVTKDGGQSWKKQ